jgi:hypothetical protein
MTQRLRRTPKIIRRARGVNCRIHRPTLPSITTNLPVPQPRQLVREIITVLSLRPSPVKIGRKHKAHRQELAQGKPWRETEKGRGKGKGKGRGKGRHFKMGNEESRVVDADTPPQTLEARTVEALAQYIKDGRAKRVVVMVRDPSPSPKLRWLTT